MWPSIWVGEVAVPQRKRSGNFKAPLRAGSGGADEVIRISDDGAVHAGFNVIRHVRDTRFDVALCPGVGVLLGVNQVGANVILDHLRHQAGDAAANARDHMHDPFAVGFLVQRALDGLDLAADAADARHQSLLLFDGV